jgi:hypothetical protein
LTLLANTALTGAKMPGRHWSAPLYTALHHWDRSVD